jgi:hypothetical protein
VWEVGNGPDGTTELTFVTKNLSSGKVRAELPLDLVIVMGADLGLVDAALVRRGDRICEEVAKEQAVILGYFSLTFEKNRVMVLGAQEVRCTREQWKV